MNRNDHAVQPSDRRKGFGGLNNEDYLRSPMKSPRRSVPASPMKSPRRTPLQKPKGGLLEDFSVHLSLPSFHNKNQGKMTWKCIACSYENCNTISNECSICGMQRSTDDVLPDASSTWQDSASTLDSASVSSFGGGTFDGDNSSNSLSLHNSFSSIHEADLLMDAERLNNNHKRPFSGHTSLPAANFNNSFTSIRSTRSTRSGFRGSRRNNNNNNNRRQPRAVEHDDNNDSVMSFCDWNPNEKLQSWSCQQCTFINENPLHLACEMCGHRRRRKEDEQKQQEEEEKNEEEEIRLIEEEQMRELIEVQRDLMNGFGVANAAAAASPPRAASPPAAGRFDTRDLQRELNHVVTPQEVSRPIMTTAAGSSPLSFLEDINSDDDDDEIDEQDRLEDLLASTRELLMDFKRQRSLDEEISVVAAAAKLDSKPAATPSGMISPSAGLGSGGAAYKSGANESISGRNAPNVTPKSATTCLKYSMKATGGKLTYNDLCLPLLWGEDLDDLKKGKASKTTTTASSSS